MKNSLFHLPQTDEIDYIKTVQALKQFFTDYKRLRLIAGEARKLPTMTTMYKITPPTFSNQFHSKVEDAALHNIDKITAAQEEIWKYSNIINQLDQIKRKIIIEFFLYGYRDIDIMIDIPYEEAQYKREKRKAVIELATTLQIEVLK
jgi:ArpU family phage transcriptional regulator